MTRALRLAAQLVGVVAVGAVIGSWVALGVSPPDLEAEDAADVALGALEEVGFEASPAAPPERGVYDTEEGESVDTWVVSVDVDGETIELQVQQSVGQLVYVDDRIGPDDSERLLTDQQYDRLRVYGDDTVVQERRWLGVAASVAALAVAAVGFTMARNIERLRRRG